MASGKFRDDFRKFFADTFILKRAFEAATELEFARTAVVLIMRDWNAIVQSQRHSRRPADREVDAQAETKIAGVTLHGEGVRIELHLAEVVERRDAQSL